jgi:hypothetical protein
MGRATTESALPIEPMSGIGTLSAVGGIADGAAAAPDCCDETERSGGADPAFDSQLQTTTRHAIDARVS